MCIPRPVCGIRIPLRILLLCCVVTEPVPFGFQVHVNLLLMEARMQAELLYALRAITRHLT